ncbi:hypothetical protein VTI74DRAFT_3750 [Chaetomium olivicolor]
MQLRAPATLLSLLAIPWASTASPVALPRSEPGCSDISFKSFAWEVHNFDFHASYIFTTPAHQNSWGFVSFELYNPADKTSTHCEASSNQLQDFFYGTVQYKCGDSGSTSFDFSRPANQLRVNQSWVCDDKDPQWPTTFTGRGEVTLPLDCTDETWQNPNWELGQIYSSRNIKCKPVQATIVPFELTAVA